MTDKLISVKLSGEVYTLLKEKYKSLGYTSMTGAINKILYDILKGA